MIRFAVVGCGFIGRRHIEMIVKNLDCKLVATCDIDDKCYTPLMSKTIGEMLKTESDIVSICTPNGLHADHAIECLEAGRHVVIEKPMALNKADCERIINTAYKYDKKVFCVMQNRYSPPSMWLKDIVSNKTLGEIYMVQLNCYWNRDERYYKKGWKGSQELDGGTLFTQFSHWIDLMYWIFGDIKNIKSRFADFNHRLLTDFEDSGFVSFDFVQGGIGSINYSTALWDSNLESSITVIGEKGSVKVGGQYMNEVNYCHIKDYVMPALPESNPANDYGHYKGSAANHNYIIQNVVDTLQGKECMTTNAMEGLKVVEIIENIYKGNQFINHVS